MTLFYSIKKQLTGTGLLLYGVLFFGYQNEIIPFEAFSILSLLNIGFLSLGNIMLLSGKIENETIRKERQKIIDNSMVFAVIISMIVIILLNELISILKI